MLRREVCDHDGYQVLGGVPLGSPGLSKTEDDVGAGHVALSQSVLFKRRQEVVVVVKHLGPLLFLQGITLFTG